MSHLLAAVAFGLNQHACTGQLGGIRFARGLLASEPSFEQVLCVTADRFPEETMASKCMLLQGLVRDGWRLAPVGCDRWVAAEELPPLAPVRQAPNRRGAPLPQPLRPLAGVAT